MIGYIHSYCSISRIDSFEKGILAAQDNIGEEVFHPEYKEVIPPALIRRMSPLIRMGVGSAIKAKGDFEVGGVIVGTGLGCIENTEKFLDQFTGKEEGILAPTSFIQSTHNTVAGQIGLILKVNGYNSTYTQRGVSFENALLDAMMLANEKHAPILVGGIDEATSLMKELGEKASVDTSNLCEGASFFILSDQPDSAKARVMACSFVHSSPATITSTIQDFLDENELATPDVILYGNSMIGMSDIAAPLEVELIPYHNISGVHMANSAFGLHMAVELIESASHPDKQKILILNNFANKDFGLTYVDKV